MIIIKFTILLLIFASSTSIGYLISKKYINRVIELKQFRNTINILENKIKFTYEPIPEIFKQISNNSEENISKIFQKASEYIIKENTKDAWNKAIEDEESNLSLNKEDINIIKSMGNMLRKNGCRWAS